MRLSSPRRQQGAHCYEAVLAVGVAEVEVQRWLVEAVALLLLVEVDQQ